MSEKFDLYTILKTYANRTKNPRMLLDSFVRFLQINSVNENAAKQCLSDWATDTHNKVMRGLDDLVQSEKIMLSEKDGRQIITLLTYYPEVISSIYTKMDESVDVPLPDEKSLKITVPPEYLRAIVVGPGLVSYLADPQSSDLPLLKLTFPRTNGAALALSRHLPRRLLDLSLAKLRDYFRRYKTLDFFQQKLLARFYTQEMHIKEFIQMLMVRTDECINTITEGGDFSFSVWMFLCQLIDNHTEEQVERANERKPVYIALAQSASLVLAISNYYKVMAMEAREKEFAFASLDRMLSEPPYLYTMKDIYSHKTAKGQSITETYGEKDVNDFIAKQLANDGSKNIPELVKFKQGAGEDWIIKKEKVIPLCNKLIKDIGSTISFEIKNRWTKKLREYKMEPAMKYDDLFEELIAKNVNLFSPPLAAIARDKRTALIQEEAGPYPTDESVFNNYKPVPWRLLFHFKRDSLLMSCRSTLPIWYSFPFVVKVVAFFKYGPKSLSEASRPAPTTKRGGGPSNKDMIKTAAEKIAESFLPNGLDSSAYLEQLNERWNQILNKKEREKVRRDLNSIIKNYMTQVLKIQARTSITEDTIDDTCQNIIDLNKTLKTINDKNSLRLYIKTYILKLLADSKF